MKELWRGELEQYLTALDQVAFLLKSVEKKMDLIAKRDERVKRVMQIDGVGRVPAEAIVCAIDDAKRFKNGRQVSAYAGLVPKQYQSGETDRRGRITKRGPRLLRTLLLECAWCSLRYNQWSRATYQRIHGGKQVRRKKAAIALARKILVITWAMLRDGIAFPKCSHKSEFTKPDNGSDHRAAAIDLQAEKAARPAAPCALYCYHAIAKMFAPARVSIVV